MRTPRRILRLRPCRRPLFQLNSCWLAGLLAGWLAGWLACWLAGLLACWLAGLLAGWLAGWLACWLAGLLAGLLAGWLAGWADWLAAGCWLLAWARAQAGCRDPGPGGTQIEGPRPVYGNTLLPGPTNLRNQVAETSILHTVSQQTAEPEDSSCKHTLKYPKTAAANISFAA